MTEGLEFPLLVAPSHMQLPSSSPTDWEQLTMQRRLTFGACEGVNNRVKATLIFFWLLLLFRGVILYAMVCGRLPFGDDSQVANNVTKPLNFPVPLIEGS